MHEHRQANPFRRIVRATASWRPLSWFYARTLHHMDRLVYRLTRGRATFTSWVAGLPIVMLTTTGCKSGRRHTLPLVALPEGERLVVIASNYGQSRNPGLVPQPAGRSTGDGLLRGRDPRHARA